MSGLFNFLTVANLLIFLLCIIGLYYSINLVIYYYANTATPFVNMYFLYYIFFIITLLISVACNNYIEMTDSDSDIGDISLTSKVAESIGIPIVDNSKVDNPIIGVPIVDNSKIDNPIIGALK